MNGINILMCFTLAPEIELSLYKIWWSYEDAVEHLCRFIKSALTFEESIVYVQNPPHIFNPTSLNAA